MYAVLICVAIWQGVVGARFFHQQRDYYGILTPGLFAALEMIRDSAPEDAVVAVTSIRDAPLGWWVEAITGRETYYASALRWLAYEDEIGRARIGNQIFTRTFPDAGSIEIVARHDIDYLVIPTRWAFYDPDRLTGLGDFGNVVFSTGDAIVIETERGEVSEPGGSSIRPP